MIELSLLGPLEPIAGAEEIEIGRHGLVIEKGVAPRAAVAAGGHRVELGLPAVSRPDVPQGRPAAGRLEARRQDLEVRGRGVRRGRGRSGEAAMNKIVVFSGNAHRAAGGRPVQTAEGAAQPGRHRHLQQQLSGRAARSQLPAGRRVHRPAAGAARAGAPDGAAADAGRGAGSVGGAHHGGDPALRLCPLGQEGRAAHLDCRAAGRGPAGDGRRQPRLDDDAAFRTGARVLQRAGRSHERPQGAGAAFPRPHPEEHDRRVAGPGQREGRQPLRPHAEAARGGRQQTARERRPRRDRRHRRRRRTGST